MLWSARQHFPQRGVYALMVYQAFWMVHRQAFCKSYVLILIFITKLEPARQAHGFMDVITVKEASQKS